ncbi:hypothetical protein C8A00DRAFT_12550 [Chaetomidium leptoderma]|uniref:Uncharacterized protein n=1 Tax=Chaetomidium leptoderma TaxID=669021 RepID=A0AAN6VSL4_9PEZI|nr:hypothetical protein C8A00DRAFT_12550 [Chaetomidium leptoderma]
MPVPIAAKVGIVAASVVVAAAIAIYEIPEVRRTAEQLRQRIAIALHSLGDNVDPNTQEPRFNRPEDAEGFYQTHDVDADEETRRRQREELMYWNMRREEQEQQRQQQEPQQRSRGSSFDDFLERDRTSDSGTFVYNSGANAWDQASSNVIRRRGNGKGVRGLNAAVLSDPFGDEHGIELEERAQLLPPARDEVMSDIYNATPLVRSPLQPAPVQALPVLAAGEVLFDFDAHAPISEYGTAWSEVHQKTAQPQTEQANTSAAAASRSSNSSATLDRELGEDEYMTAGQDDRTAEDAYASIQAWAQNSSNTGFYSPLPNTPQAPLSEPEMVSEGQLTPTDSASVVDVANDVVSASGEPDFDVMSETEGGIPTPGSWSEVGSVISESESAARA